MDRPCSDTSGLGGQVLSTRRARASPARGRGMPRRRNRVKKLAVLARTCPHGHNPSRNGTNPKSDRGDADRGDGGESNDEHALRLGLNDYAHEQREAQKDYEALRECSHEPRLHLLPHPASSLVSGIPRAKHATNKRTRGGGGWRSTATSPRGRGCPPGRSRAAPHPCARRRAPAPRCASTARRRRHERRSSGHSRESRRAPRRRH